MASAENAGGGRVNIEETRRMLDEALASLRFSTDAGTSREFDAGDNFNGESDDAGFATSSNWARGSSAGSNADAESDMEQIVREEHAAAAWDDERRRMFQERRGVVGPDGTDVDLEDLRAMEEAEEAYFKELKWRWRRRKMVVCSLLVAAVASQARILTGPGLLFSAAVALLTAMSKPPPPPPEADDYMGGEEDYEYDARAISPDDLPPEVRARFPVGKHETDNPSSTISSFKPMQDAYKRAQVNAIAAAASVAAAPDSTGTSTSAKPSGTKSVPTVSKAGVNEKSSNKNSSFPVATQRRDTAAPAGSARSAIRSIPTGKRLSSDVDDDDEDDGECVGGICPRRR